MKIRLRSLTGLHIRLTLTPLKISGSFLKILFAISFQKNRNSLSRLENTAKECWMELRKEVLEAEIRSMPNRLQTVITAKGWYTKY